MFLNHAMYSEQRAFYLVVSCFLILLCVGCGSDTKQNQPLQTLFAARQAWLKNDFNKSEILYQKYLQNFPEDGNRIEAWKRLADIAFSVHGSAAQAVNILEVALLEKGIDALQFYELSLQAINLSILSHQYEKCIAFSSHLLNKAALSPKQLVHVYLKIEQSYSGLGDFAHSINTLNECLHSVSDRVASSPCTLRLASLLSKADTLKAISLLLEIYNNLEISSVLRAEAAFTLGEIAESKHDIPTAKFWFSSIVDIYPNTKVVQKKLELLKK
jgi:hypothetical protein